MSVRVYEVDVTLIDLRPCGNARERFFEGLGCSVQVVWEKGFVCASCLRMEVSVVDGH